MIPQQARNGKMTSLQMTKYVVLYVVTIFEVTAANSTYNTASLRDYYNPGQSPYDFK